MDVEDLAAKEREEITEAANASLEIITYLNHDENSLGNFSKNSLPRKYIGSSSFLP
jgi:hypothetical protein